MKELYPWQDEIWKRLLGVRDRLPNSLLLKGSKGIGKLDLAQDFAKALLCNAPLATGLACENCSSCHWFSLETHPDYRFIQPDSLTSTEDETEKEGGKKASREISVDQIRSLSSFINLSSHVGGYRVVLIHPAENMNNNAANALLKTLEEPTDKLLFILVTHKPQQLLPTILSRSLSVTVPNPAAEVSSNWLKLQGIVDPHAALALSGFAPLAALQWAADSADSEERKLILNAIKQPGGFDALSLAEQLQRSSPALLIHLLQQWCYDLCSFKLAGRIRYYPELTDSISKSSKNIGLHILLRYAKELQSAKREAFHPLNPKLLFESLLLSYQQMSLSKNYN